MGNTVSRTLSNLYSYTAIIQLIFVQKSSAFLHLAQQVCPDCDQAIDLWAMASCLCSAHITYYSNLKTWCSALRNGEKLWSLQQAWLVYGGPSELSCFSSYSHVILLISTWRAAAWSSAQATGFSTGAVVLGSPSSSRCFLAGGPLCLTASGAVCLGSCPAIFQSPLLNHQTWSCSLLAQSMLKARVWHTVQSAQRKAGCPAFKKNISCHSGERLCQCKGQNSFEVCFTPPVFRPRGETTWVFLFPASLLGMNSMCLLSFISAVCK